MKLSKKILSLLLAASLVLSSGMVLAAANGQNPSTSTTGPANPDPDDTELNCPESENGYHVGTPKTVSKEATCSDFGIVTLDECEACHKKLVPVIVKKDKDKHTAEMQELQYVDSTCTNTGNYETFHCDDCGEYYTKDKDGNPQYVEVEDPQDLANTEGVVIAMKAHDYDTEHPTDMKRTFVCAFEVTYKCKNCTSTKVVRIAEDPDDVLDPHTPVTDAAVEPTCTEPGLTEGSHCSVCGITIVAQKTLPATDHKFGEWEMLDVTEEGLLQHKGICQNESRKQLCRETLTEDCYDAEPVYTAATCTEDAYWTNTCDKCGRKWETTDEENPATGHTWVEREELKILPTCTEQGQNIYRCAVCDEEYTEYTHDTHHYNSEPTDKEKEPTCTEVGYDEVYVCTVCGEPKYKGMKDMVPHTPAEAVKDNIVDATCKKEGSYDSVVYCSVCDEELSREVKTIDKLAHTPAEAVKENIVDATCKEEGSYDSVIYCSVCEEELSRETVTTELIAHTPKEAVKENEVDATCKEEGSYDSVIYCSVCDEELSRETVTLDKVAHTPAEAVKDNIVDATCTETGSYDSVIYCSVCEEELSRETVTTELIAHTPKEAVKENEVDATCKEEGSYDSVIYCSVCDEELSRETVTLDKVAHTPAEAVKDNIVDATCTETGSYDSVIYCSVCEEELSRETVTTELIAHTPKEAVKENEVDATCKEEGSYDSVIYCSVCDEELSRETVTLDKVAHTPAEAVKENEVDATCTEQGSYDSVIYCSVCEEELSRETVTLDKVAHTPAEAVKDNIVDATCTETGSFDSVVYCSVCDEELSRETVTTDVIPHDFTKKVIDDEHLVSEATCTEAAVYKYECTVCGTLGGDDDTFEYGDKLGHDEVDLIGYPADYHKLGITDGKHCNRCGIDTVPQEVIPYITEKLDITYTLTGLNGDTKTASSGTAVLEIRATSEHACLFGLQLELGIKEGLKIRSYDDEHLPGFANFAYTEVEAANNAGVTKLILDAAPEKNVEFSGEDVLLARIVFDVDDTFTGMTGVSVISGTPSRQADLNNKIDVDFGTGAEIQAVLLGDANRDGITDINDLKDFNSWDLARGEDAAAYDSVFDFNDDGIVDGLDFIMMRKAIVAA